jgi:hypothetical protein
MVFSNPISRFPAAVCIFFKKIKIHSRPIGSLSLERKRSPAKSPATKTQAFLTTPRPMA